MKRITLVLCMFLFVLGTGFIASAQAVSPDETTLAIGTPGSQAAGVAPAGQGTLWSLVRMLIVLVLLLGGVYLAIVLVRRASPRASGSDNPIKLAASLVLAPGKSIHAVCLGSKAYLIGTSESSVSLIDTIDEVDLVDELTLRASTRAPIRQADFAGIMERLPGGRGKKGSDLSRSSDFLASQRDRLKKT